MRSSIVRLTRRSRMQPFVTAVVALALLAPAVAGADGESTRSMGTSASSQLSRGDRALLTATRGAVWARQGLGNAARAVGRAVGPAAQTAGRFVGRAADQSLRFRARHTWNAGSRVRGVASEGRIRASARVVATADRMRALWSNRNNPAASSREITRSVTAREYTRSQVRFERHNGERMRVRTDRTYQADARGRVTLQRRDDVASRGVNLSIYAHRTDLGSHSASADLTRDERGRLQHNGTTGTVSGAGVAPGRTYNDPIGVPAVRNSAVEVRGADGRVADRIAFPPARVVASGANSNQ
jgi:hypothetical protein